jgi:drug/metabolite transporter (DMT)-like permease
MARARSGSAVAAVLLATVPLFAMFVDAATVGEPITVRGIVGTLAAVLGVLVLSF